jgi:3-dehydroquinate synthase
LKEYASKDFTIFSGNDCFEVLLENIVEAAYTRVFVLVDENTEKHCMPLLSKYLFDMKLIRLKSGEQYKVIDSAQLIWNELQKQNADRQSLLINLGGGVIGDLGGFCAATFKRGLDFYNIPTTLLSMVDSSIGGKTGIDYNGVKNAIGIFQHPKQIYINPDFLDRLPQPEMVNGYAEIIKHALIADKDLWEKLSVTNLNEWPKYTSIINTSIKIKLEVVKKDPTEKNLRKLLNFGHTIGHAIEAYSLTNDSKPLKHGEAVAIGIICESFLSKELMGLNGKDLKLISDYMLSHFRKYSLKNIFSHELIHLMKQDKKNLSEEINFTLLKKIGKGSINHTCSEHQIRKALQYYESL